METIILGRKKRNKNSEPSMTFSKIDRRKEVKLKLNNANPDELDIVKEQYRQTNKAVKGAARKFSKLGPNSCRLVLPCYPRKHEKRANACWTKDKAKTYRNINTAEKV